MLGWRNQPHHWRQQPLHVSAAWLQWRSDKIDKPRKCGKEMHDPSAWSHRSFDIILDFVATLVYKFKQDSSWRYLSDWNILIYWNIMSMSARRTAVEYDLFHTVDDRGCFQPSTHLQRANAASTRVYSVYSLVAYSFNVVDSSWQSHQFKKKRKFLARDFPLATSKNMKSGQHRTKTPFAAAQKVP